MKFKQTLIAGLVAAVFILLPMRSSYAQLVHEGSQFPGVALSVNFNEGEDLPIGVNYEYFVSRDFAIGGMFRYWTYTAWSDPNSSAKYVFTNYLIAAQGNYHFKVPQRELDPFMGFVIGDRVGNGAMQNAVGVQAPPIAGVSGIVFAIQAGARYFVSDKIGLEGRLLFGSGGVTVFEVGADFAM